MWKSKEGKGKTAAQLLIDVTAQVTKRLAATIMDVIDLSLIRSVVEIFFRPVEGSLTLKSNRFLKLEAGNNECKMPTEAFNPDAQRKMQEAIDKKAMKGLSGVGTPWSKLCELMASLARNNSTKYESDYDACCKSLANLNFSLSLLSALADDKSTAEKPVKVCKTYDDLKDKLYSQDKNEDWLEGDIGFTDQVATADNTVIRDDVLRRICKIPNTRILSNQERENYNKDAIDERKTKKKLVLNVYNELRSNIYKLTHRVPTEDDVATAVGQLQGLPAMPKDYKKKVLAAFDPKKLADVPRYTFISDDDKKLARRNNNVQAQAQGQAQANANVVDPVVILKRLLIINLLEELGFKDDTRLKLNEKNQPAITGKVPEKPTAATLNDKTWAAYVASLSGFPPITMAPKETTFGGALKGALKDAAGDQWKKIAFWKDLAERKTWSDGKKGKILFATSKDTFCMNDNGIGVLPSPFESNTSKPSDANNVLDDQTKQTIQGYVNDLKRILNSN